MLSNIVQQVPELAKVDEFVGFTIDVGRYLLSTAIGLKCTIIAWDYISNDRESATAEIRNIVHAICMAYFGPLVAKMAINKFVEILGK